MPTDGRDISSSGGMCAGAPRGHWHWLWCSESILTWSGKEADQISRVFTTLLLISNPSVRIVISAVTFNSLSDGEAAARFHFGAQRVYMMLLQCTHTKAGEAGITRNLPMGQSKAPEGRWYSIIISPSPTSPPFLCCIVVGFTN